MIALLAVLVGLLALPSAAHGAGELDPTFDGDGKVVTDFGAGEFASDVAIQTDGKIVAAGGLGFALARYNPDGSLDPTFDGDGKVVSDLGFQQAFSVAIQTDGKIVAAGMSGSGANPFDFALARYNPDGSLDPTFDGDGKVVSDFGRDDRTFDVAIQADGKIVAAGETGAGVNPDNFLLARYNPDGSLDPTFDGDGSVVTDFGGFELGPGGLAIQADGKIVAAGGGGGFALARYKPDGSLDPTFDGDGKVVTDFGRALDVAIQADGKIVAAGGGGDFALARFNPDGSLDPTFHGDGRVETGFGADFDEASGVAIQADGKIVAAGVSGAFDAFDFALARYNPDGSLDPTFARDGRVVTDFGASEGANGVAIQADGKIVAAGGSDAGTNPPNFVLVRYLAGPTNLPPDCSAVAASPNRLWPPNHRFRLATVSGATDPDGDAVTLVITGVTQDERLRGPGDHTSPDARPTSAPDVVRLRAERNPRGNGRVYRISFTGSDGKGGTCSSTVTVAVSHDQGKPAVDSAPPSYNSFGP